MEHERKALASKVAELQDYVTDLEGELADVKKERDKYLELLSTNRNQVAELTSLTEAQASQLRDLQRQLDRLQKQRLSLTPISEQPFRAPNRVIHALKEKSIEHDSEDDIEIVDPFLLKSGSVVIKEEEEESSDVEIIDDPSIISNIRTPTKRSRIPDKDLSDERAVKRVKEEETTAIGSKHSAIQKHSGPQVDLSYTANTPSPAADMYLRYPSCITPRYKTETVQDEEVSPGCTGRSSKMEEDDLPLAASTTQLQSLKVEDNFTRADTSPDTANFPPDEDVEIKTEVEEDESLLGISHPVLKDEDFPMADADATPSASDSADNEDEDRDDSQLRINADERHNCDVSSHDHPSPPKSQTPHSSCPREISPGTPRISVAPEHITSQVRPATPKVRSGVPSVITETSTTPRVAASTTPARASVSHGSPSTPPQGRRLVSDASNVLVTPPSRTNPTPPSRPQKPKPRVSTNESFFSSQASTSATKPQIEEIPTVDADVGAGPSVSGPPPARKKVQPSQGIVDNSVISANRETRVADPRRVASGSRTVDPRPGARRPAEIHTTGTEVGMSSAPRSADRHVSEGSAARTVDPRIASGSRGSVQASQPAQRSPAAVTGCPAPIPGSSTAVAASSSLPDHARKYFRPIAPKPPSKATPSARRTRIVSQPQPKAHPPPLDENGFESFLSMPAFNVEPFDEEPLPIHKRAIADWAGGAVGRGVTFTMAKNGRHHIFIDSENCPHFKDVVLGAPILVFIAHNVDVERITVFLHHDNVYYHYGGEYECQFQQLGLEDFLDQGKEFKRLFVKKKYLLDLRLWDRFVYENTDTFLPITPEEEKQALKALESGKEKIFVGFLRCKSFEKTVVDAIQERWKTAIRVGMYPAYGAHEEFN
ncbi:hypothetical protein H0H92_014507 [Tricholoma furcatifolium]|nr:hypothetical protein H0H92_014507 [Tricholoma furcatifolium]